MVDFALIMQEIVQAEEASWKLPPIKSEVSESYPGHKGVPGQYGGSAPKGADSSGSAPELTHYLSQVATAFPNQNTRESFVLKSGMACNVTPNTIPGKGGKAKECYSNAYHLASSNQDLTYIEGYALMPKLGIPLEHAWCIDKANNVIDPTWKTPGIEYFGIPFNLRFVDRVISGTETYGVLDFTSPIIRDAYDHGWSADALAKFANPNQAKEVLSNDPTT
jgi:hypothetical protein